MTRRTPVSIVCVWNNEAMRAQCLDRSIDLLRDQAPETEYLPVDNRGQVHPTAGSALNAGVRAATRDVIAFVQQDIFLHSLEALEVAAGYLMNDPGLGLIGSVGISADGRIVGRMRDRVVLIGESHATPQRVDSLDEVLFLARRETLLAEPISEVPDLAWHAYAVEYGLRMRDLGLEVAAVDIPITHNSMSTNLARLDDAHVAVALMHPSRVPVRTTCGTVTADMVASVEAQPARGLRRVADNQRWRWRWLRKSWAAARVKRASRDREVVLADLREDIDQVLAASSDPELVIWNVTSLARPFPGAADGTLLRRGDHAVRMRSTTWERIGGRALMNGTHLVNNVSVNQVAALVREVRHRPHVTGYHEDTGYWLLVGDVAARWREMWPEPQHRPLRALV